MRISVFVLTIAAGLLVYSGSALACSTCGCQSSAKAEACACGMDPADCTMCSSGDTMASHSDYNCACDKPIYDCAPCLKSESAKTAAHLGSSHPLPDGITVLSRTVDPFAVAYMETRGMDDIESTFSDLMKHAGKQGILSDSTRVYGVYHGDLYGEYDDDTVYQAAVSVPADMSPAAPVKHRMITGGEYLVVLHRGSYDNMAVTYESFLSWAAEAGVPFDTRPSFEHYLSDPGTTPEAGLVTEIYLPVANPHSGSHDGHDHA